MFYEPKRGLRFMDVTHNKFKLGVNACCDSRDELSRREAG